MSENTYQLQQLAQIYRYESEINTNRAYKNRQEAEKFANFARENPEHINECLAQEQEYIGIATTWEKIAAIQLQYAVICENPVNEYQTIRNDLLALLDKIRVCQAIQCSNEACREILNLIEAYYLKNSVVYESYLQCCGHVN
ncbi:hypothetical protein [Calothrix sp. NIES-2098]|uniref:hypothetical protein n=1 Tax=Calothrix sp. NIES-2098 TaxID=1954171 RepID=UPI000B5F364E|nr:hypothetical protein NIES2098_51400 [Calothrix sp. NIES-2098]